MPSSGQTLMQSMHFVQFLKLCFTLIIDIFESSAYNARSGQILHQTALFATIVSKT